jgi:DNA-binding HxlR family transcriptional regulator
MHPIDFNGLDTTVHGPVRLGILTALHTDGPLDFTTLKKRLDVVDGVLGLHVEKLGGKGYVASRRAYLGRRPRTTYYITRAGRGALRRYLAAMQALIDAVEKAEDV